MLAAQRSQAQHLSVCKNTSCRMDLQKLIIHDLFSRKKKREIRRTTAAKKLSRANYVIYYTFLIKKLKVTIEKKKKRLN